MFCESKRAGDSRNIRLCVAQKQLNQKDHIVRVNLADHIIRLFLIPAAAENIIQVPQQGTAALSILKDLYRTSDIAFCHCPLKCRIDRSIPSAAHGINETPGLLCPGSVMDMMKQPAPEFLLLIAVSKIHSPALKHRVDQGCDEFSVPVFQIELAHIDFAIFPVINFIQYLDDVRHEQKFGKIAVTKFQQQPDRRQLGTDPFHLNRIRLQVITDQRVLTITERPRTCQQIPDDLPQFFLRLRLSQHRKISDRHILFKSCALKLFFKQRMPGLIKMSESIGHRVMYQLVE